MIFKRFGTMEQRIVLSAAFILAFLSPMKAFMISTSSVANCRCNSRPLSADVHSEGIAPSQTDLTADNRFEFLRNVGMTVASTVSGLALLPEMGKAEVVTDDVLGFKFETPEGWERSDAQISGRRKVVVYANPKNPGANAFVAYTPVRGDFTSLGSFGTLDEVSKTVLPQAQGVTSRMVDSYTDKKSYVYDYLVDQEGRPAKHIKTMWMLFPDNGQLVTVTAQCDEADYPSFGKAIDKIIASITKT